jgi:hypothetical protein
VRASDVLPVHESRMKIRAGVLFSLVPGSLRNQSAERLAARAQTRSNIPIPEEVLRLCLLNIPEG